MKLPGERYHMIADSSVVPLHDFRLTSREEEIAELLATGLTAKQIGVRLRIANETVRSHTRTIYLKLRVKNKVELAGKIFRMHNQVPE
jgi:DNA-binding NarL/FixJ family response regulator